MKTIIQWAIGLLIFIAIVAIIGNVDVYLESRFPNPMSEQTNKPKNK